MLGHELAVEQRETADPHPRDQPGHGDLGSIGGAAEHGFAEESPAESEPVKPTDEP
jgi:hypothetical protein